MAIFTSVTTVSFNYYYKRSREFCLQQVKFLHEALKTEAPAESTWDGKSKGDLCNYLLSLHRQFPEEVA